MLLQQKPLNVITFGQTKSDNIDRIITITDDFDIATCRQFHQHFKCKFFVRTPFQQLFCSYMYLEKAAETMFVQKIRT